MPKTTTTPPHDRRQIVRSCISKVCRGSANTKTVTETNLKRIRRRLTKRPGWSTTEFDTHLAEWVLEGSIRVKYRTNEVREAGRRVAGRVPQLGLSVEVQTLAQSQHSAAAREAQRVQAAVLRWIKRRCRVVHSNGVSTWQVEAAHLNDMKQNISARAVAVQASVAILAAHGVLCIKQDRERSRGKRRPSPWVDNALSWAAESEWIRRDDVQQLHTKALHNICTAHDSLTPSTVKAGQGAKAIVELGCGWEGATEGLQRVFQHVVTLDRQQQLISGRGSAEGCAGEKVTSHPSILADFRRPCDNLVHWARKRSGMGADEVCAVWASPSCTGHSKRQGMLNTKESARHRAQGKFAGKPISDDDKEATEAVFDAVWDWWREDQTRQYCIENVQAADMGAGVEARFGRGIVVKACRFGKQSGKTHRLWLTKDAEAAFLRRYNDPERTPRCQYCDVWPRRKHPQSGLPNKGSGQEREREPGKTPAAARNRTRPALAQAVAEVMLQVHLGLKAQLPSC